MHKTRASNKPEKAIVEKKICLRKPLTETRNNTRHNSQSKAIENYQIMNTPLIVRNQKNLFSNCGGNDSFKYSTFQTDLKQITINRIKINQVEKKNLFRNNYQYKVVLIQKWWKKIYKIIRIQKMIRGFFSRFKFLLLLDERNKKRENIFLLYKFIKKLIFNKFFFILKELTKSPRILKTKDKRKFLIKRSPINKMKKTFNYKRIKPKPVYSNNRKFDASTYRDIGQMSSPLYNSANADGDYNEQESDVLSTSRCYHRKNLSLDNPSLKSSFVEYKKDLLKLIKTRKLFKYWNEKVQKKKILNKLNRNIALEKHCNSFYNKTKQRKIIIKLIKRKYYEKLRDFLSILINKKIVKNIENILYACFSKRNLVNRRKNNSSKFRIKHSTNQLQYKRTINGSVINNININNYINQSNYITNDRRFLQNQSFVPSSSRFKKILEFEIQNRNYKKITFFKKTQVLSNLIKKFREKKRTTFNKYGCFIIWRNTKMLSRKRSITDIIKNKHSNFIETLKEINNSRAQSPTHGMGEFKRSYRIRKRDDNIMRNMSPSYMNLPSKNKILYIDTSPNPYPHINYRTKNEFYPKKNIVCMNINQRDVYLKKKVAPLNHNINVSPKIKRNNNITEERTIIFNTNTERNENNKHQQYYRMKKNKII